MNTREQIIKRYPYATIKEIEQQVLIWNKIKNKYEQQLSEITKKIFVQLKNLQANSESLKVIISGAGSSNFVGKYIANHLIGWKRNLNVHAFATTDILTDPKKYFNDWEHIIYVSIARSGNSPESCHALHLAHKYCQQGRLKIITITCNKDGQLVKDSANFQNKEIIVLPPETHDRGFAMTSSFTSMVLTLLLIFKPEKTKSFLDHLFPVWDSNQATLDKIVTTIYQSVKKQKWSRVIFLGSNELNSLAKEAALKCLELTSGKILTFHNSFLGARHGQKLLINKKSLVIAILSNNHFKRQYELDFVKELHQQKDINNTYIMAFDCFSDQQMLKQSDLYHNLNFLNLSYEWHDVYLGLIYIYFLQHFAVAQAIHCQCNVDNPSPVGLVNRVVQGVICYADDETIS